MNTENKSAGYGIILLAAGASTRLGKPKQLLAYQGKTLLQHALQVAVDTCASPVMAVIGAGADIFEQEIKYPVQAVINNQWEEGMASSIRCGLTQLLNVEPATKAVIIMVCDQPFVTAQLFQDLITKYEQSGKAIVASSYKNSLGTPALFDKTIFAALLELKGDTGAKKLMKANPNQVDEVQFPMGEIDIDTEADYERLPLPSESCR